MDEGIIATRVFATYLPLILRTKANPLARQWSGILERMSSLWSTKIRRRYALGHAISGNHWPALAEQQHSQSGNTEPHSYLGLLPLTPIFSCSISLTEQTPSHDNVHDSRQHLYLAGISCELTLRRLVGEHCLSALRR